MTVPQGAADDRGLGESQPSGTELALSVRSANWQDGTGARWPGMDEILEVLAD